MQLQIHPASGRGVVRTFSVDEIGVRALIVLAAVLALAAVSLWLSVPAFVGRRLREDSRQTMSRSLEESRARWEVLRARNLALAERALNWGDLLNRVAFLYALPPGQWPKAMDPQRGLMVKQFPDPVSTALELYLRALDRSYDLVAREEQGDPNLASRVPAILPVGSEIVEPSAFFGPRTSPWTGEEEFYLGVDLAAPQGSPVVASGAATVAFAGTVRRAPAGWFWRLGNVVVLSHGASGVTVYGHLDKIEVRRGQQVARGDRLGTIGSTGWAMSPQLHYEYWRPEGHAFRPTDPLFATLDRRLGSRRLSLEQMIATSAPGPFEALPGVEISASAAAGPAERHAPPPRRSARRRRI